MAVLMVATCVALLFTAQKEYLSTLWTVQTRRFCFNHESKCLRIVSDWLLLLKNGSKFNWWTHVLFESSRCE